MRQSPHQRELRAARSDWAFNLGSYKSLRSLFWEWHHLNSDQEDEMHYYWSEMKRSARRLRVAMNRAGDMS